MKGFALLLIPIFFLGCKTANRDASQTESIRGISENVAYLAFPSTDKKSVCLDKYKDSTYYARERTIACIAIGHPDYVQLRKDHPTLAQAIEHPVLFEDGPSPTEMQNYQSWKDFIQLVTTKGEPFFGAPKPQAPPTPAPLPKPKVTYKFCTCDETTHITFICANYGPTLLETNQARTLSFHTVWSDGKKETDSVEVCEGGGSNYCKSHGMTSSDCRL